MIPSGTVTFLFTDIEGSTQLWEHHPEAMKAALAKHDRILRQAIEAHSGYVFKTVGDAFCAAFERAPQALAACLQAQRDLQAPCNGLLIKVRMGFHTGTAEERDGDYFGPTLNRAARLMSAGHGGQTLLSQASCDLVRDVLPTGVDLHDLGERRLKDLVRPERIWQVDAPGLSTGFAPLKTLDSFSNNLPIQMTSFVGREGVLADLKRTLETNRLVTLTGPGGTGKTRLSLQVGAELLEAFPDGVWFVELAPLTEATLVASEVAGVLGIKPNLGQTLEQALKASLKERRLLLILDNCEHLVDASAQLAENLVRACSGVTVLASSREAFGVGGEKPFRVPSLANPDPKNLPSFETLTQFDAVRLFVDRAVQAKDGFRVTHENAAAVVQICVRLDGIPLALELAASRVKLLSAEQIASKLDDMFRLLTGGSRTALPRQQTLKALVDWSWVGLADGERRFLRRLSVFAGGFSFEAAEAVAGDQELDALDVLASLVGKSLVQADDSGAEVRYRLLETIRQYAREKLFESGEGIAVRDLHLAWFVRLAEDAEPFLTSRWDDAWVLRLDREVDNLRQALEWAVSEHEDDAAEPAYRLYHGVAEWVAARSHDLEFRSLVETAVLRDRGKPPTRLRVMATLEVLQSYSLFSGPEGLSRRVIEELIGQAVDLGDEDLVDRAFVAEAWISDQYATPEIRGNLEKASASRQARGDLFGEAQARIFLGYQLRFLGLPLSLAREQFHRSVKLFRSLGNPRGTSFALSGLAYAEWDMGNLEQAKLLLEEAELALGDLGDNRSLHWSRITRANLFLSMSRFDEADGLLTPLFPLLGKNGQPGQMAIALWIRSRIRESRGDDAGASQDVEEALVLVRGEETRLVAEYILRKADFVVRRGNLAQARQILNELPSHEQFVANKWLLPWAVETLACALSDVEPALAARGLSVVERHYRETETVRPAAVQALVDGLCAALPLVSEPEETKEEAYFALRSALK